MDLQLNCVQCGVGTIEHVEWICRKPKLLKRFAMIIQDIIHGRVGGEYKKAVNTAKLVVLNNRRRFCQLQKAKYSLE